VPTTSAKARKIAKALECHIITLSEDSLNAFDDIGQYHFPKQVQSVIFEEPLLYWTNHEGWIKRNTLERIFECPEEP